MKKVFLFKAVLFTLLVLGFSIDSLSSTGRGWVPPGSSQTQNPDGSITITPPNGWLYTGTDESGNAIAVMATSVTMKCSCSSPAGASCTPFTAGGDVGCSMGSCTSCTGTKSLANQVNIGSGGYINLSTPAEIIQQGEEVPLGFVEMFNVPAVQNLVGNFISQIYNGQTPPELDQNTTTAPAGYVWVPVNIAGRAIAILVPQSAIEGNAAYMAVAASSVSCSGCGSGHCTLESSGFGQVKYCANGCPEGCTLKTSIVSNGTPTTVFTSKAYNF